MKGTIFDIKRFALNDGPGIRTTVFLKGCPLKCAWCHNPESISSVIEEFIQVRELDGQRFESTQAIGEFVTSESLIEEIAKDKEFFRQSGGGVTFSGGEPMLQLDFLSDIITKCKAKKMHVVIDTAGLCKQSHIEKVMNQVDLFLYDLKIIDEEKHKTYTGVSNDVILKNLEFLLQNNANVIIRIPVIPGINDQEQDIVKLEQYLSDKLEYIKEIHLLPFHNSAESKYRRFNTGYSFKGVKSQDPRDLVNLKERFERKGFNVKIGGM
ncbi:glycyl-radical enzyme activating protein [Plebeiibacterium marinum]|uniref:Glycyl-radical enzyme activating protein n=1 Tax=Plebeiibacterium marinum TaxID=2992111 RepID=A0AAE3MHL2_9BACT|nr:glycyl-radical enzyme activating protein [Plebeiobacterium marinum]MCW3807615.1 glycyl-radical enzyme activating protein [Plebeiobacterium marinum]